MTPIPELAEGPALILDEGRALAPIASSLGIRTPPGVHDAIWRPGLPAGASGRVRIDTPDGVHEGPLGDGAFGTTCPGDAVDVAFSAEVAAVPRGGAWALALPDGGARVEVALVDVTAARVWSDTHAVATRVGGSGTPVTLTGPPGPLHLAWEVAGDAPVAVAVRAGGGVALLVDPAGAAAERVPQDLVVVVDRSGSQSGEAWRADTLVEALARRLGPDDRLAVVGFGAWAWTAGWGGPAIAPPCAAASNLVAGLGLAAALPGDPARRRIVAVTDGGTVDPGDPARLGPDPLFVVPSGPGAAMGWLLDRPSVVTLPASPDPAAEALLAWANPVWTNLVATVGGQRFRLPDLAAGAPLRVGLPRASGDAVLLEALAAGSPVSLRVPIRSVDPAPRPPPPALRACVADRVAGRIALDAPPPAPVTARWTLRYPP